MCTVKNLIDLQIDQAKDNGQHSITFLGYRPPIMSEAKDNIPYSISEILEYCQKKGYSIHCLDEMERPIKGLPNDWDEFDRLIINF